MNPWEEFRQRAVGKPVRLDRREFDWVFGFGEDLAICVAAMWRVRNSSQITVTDGDDGHQYGLPAPVDAQERANEVLRGATVKSIDADGSTGDLTIRLSGGIVVDVVTNSSGYESWQAYDGSISAAVGRNGG